MSNDKIEYTSTVKWFSVDNSLPPNRQRVLFATKNGDVHKSIYMDRLINQYGDFHKVFIADDGGHYQLSMDIVAFWCDIPTPPVL